MFFLHNGTKHKSFSEQSIGCTLGKTDPKIKRSCYLKHCDNDYDGGEDDGDYYYYYYYYRYQSWTFNEDKRWKDNLVSLNINQDLSEIMLEKLQGILGRFFTKLSIKTHLIKKQTSSELLQKLSWLPKCHFDAILMRQLLIWVAHLLVALYLTHKSITLNLDIQWPVIRALCGNQNVDIPILSTTSWHDLTPPPQKKTWFI